MAIKDKVLNNQIKLIDVNYKNSNKSSLITTNNNSCPLIITIKINT